MELNPDVTLIHFQGQSLTVWELDYNILQQKIENLAESCPASMADQYFSTLMGRNVTVYIHALLAHKVLLLETPDINNELVCRGFGRHVDTDTFLLLVQTG